MYHQLEYSRYKYGYVPLLRKNGFTIITTLLFFLGVQSPSYLGGLLTYRTRGKTVLFQLATPTYELVYPPSLDMRQHWHD
jgi:hypothetical protein